MPEQKTGLTFDKLLKHEEDIPGMMKGKDLDFAVGSLYVEKQKMTEGSQKIII